MHRKPHVHRGVVLIAAIFTVTLVAIYLSVAMTRTLVESQTATRYARIAQALYLAEGGVDQAIVQLNQNANFQGTLGDSLSTGQSAVTVNPPQGGVTRIQSTGTSSGTSRTLEAYVAQGDGPLFTHAAFVEDRISMTHNSYTDSYDSGLGTYELQTPGQEGDVGTNNCGSACSGTGTTSVIRLGQQAKVYGDAEIGPGYPNDPYDNSGIRIWDPVPPEGESPTVRITGERRVLSEARDIPLEADVPTGLFSTGLSCPDLILTGNDVAVFGPGEYCFNSISLAGNAKADFNGEVTVSTSTDVGSGLLLSGTSQMNFNGRANVLIQTSGNAKLKGNARVTFHDKATVYTATRFSTEDNAVFGPADKRPSQLQLIHTTDDTVKVTGNSKFYGTIFAPETKVTVSGNSTPPDPPRLAQLFGAVVASKIEIGTETCNFAAGEVCNGAIHYDKALGEASNDIPMLEGAGGFRVISWRQIN